MESTTNTKKQSSPEFTPLLHTYRKQQLKLYHAAPPTSFKYGLHIKLNPDFDFSQLAPAPTVKPTTITDCPKEYLQEDNIPEEQLSPFLENWQHEEDHNQIWHWNQANANNFTLITIPKDTASKPIQIKKTIDQGLCLSNLFIKAEPNSKATIIIQIESSSLKIPYISNTIRVIAGSNAHVNIITIHQADEKTITFQERKAKTKQNSSVNWTEINLGGKYTKSNIISDLDQEGSSSAITALFLSTGKQQIDLLTACHHNAAQTSSNIITKGVINHQAKSLNRGRITINKPAFQSQGYEKQDALLLSDDAEADAIPDLIIHNHDVRCSHGSTIGQLDQDLLFYLMSRGLNKNQAIKQIITGYFNPIMDLYQDHTTKKTIQEAIEKALT